MDGRVGRTGGNADRRMDRRWMDTYRVIDGRIDRDTDIGGWMDSYRIEGWMEQGVRIDGWMDRWQMGG